MKQKQQEKEGRRQGIWVSFRIKEFLNKVHEQKCLRLRIKRRIKHWHRDRPSAGFGIRECHDPTVVCPLVCAAICNQAWKMLPEPPAYKASTIHEPIKLITKWWSWHEWPQAVTCHRWCVATTDPQFSQFDQFCPVAFEFTATEKRRVRQLAAWMPQQKCWAGNGAQEVSGRIRFETSGWELMSLLINRMTSKYCQTWFQPLLERFSSIFCITNSNHHQTSGFTPCHYHEFWYAPLRMVTHEPHRGPVRHRWAAEAKTPQV